jgi:flagellar protein FliO/FliZ
LGGEKLYQFYKYFFAVCVISAGLFVCNLNNVSAQDAAGSSGEEFVFQWDTDADEALPAPTPTIFVVLRMVLVLALAAAAIYGVVFFFKRLSRPAAQKNPYLKVLASAPLSTGSSVSVVSLGNKAWLLGVGTGAGSSGVSLIAEITDREMVDAMLLDDSRKGPYGSHDGGRPKLLDFSALLHRLGGGGTAGERLSADDLRKRRERLNNL